FEGAGYEVECLVRGLGENEAIRKLYVEHAQAAIDSIQ
ncbi:MAG: sirohydrochlorin cobaltochelatase, partial [Oscillospiraceae bacterium]|nr:sirohydrochlorin cobaltochelatase [Oscillospiraceae bacterium]